MNKPIDKVRNSAIRATLPPDTGGIKEMVEIKGSLHMIGGTAIYRVQLADQIDPQRTNINVPDTHQKVLSYGTEFPYTRQTLMQTRRLLKDKLLGPDFDYQTGIDLSLDALQDLAAMHEAYLELLGRQEKVADDMNKLVTQGRSLTVPTIGSDMATKTHSFLQRADHAAKTLFSIAKLFYGDEIGKGMWDGLYALVLQELGADDLFPQFLEAVLPFLKFVRNARNSMEHPKEGVQSVAITDFTLMPTTELFAPMFSLTHPETPQDIIPLLDVMRSVTTQLGAVFEVTLAHLARANVQPFSGFPLGVIEYDEAMQKAYGCRFGYCSRMGDRDIPFG